MHEGLKTIYCKKDRKTYPPLDVSQINVLEIMWQSGKLNEV